LGDVDTTYNATRGRVRVRASVTPIERTASGTGLPCAVSTSTSHSLPTISSGALGFPRSALYVLPCASHSRWPNFKGGWPGLPAQITSAPCSIQ
jgi:hypothetical protein